MDLQIFKSDNSILDGAVLKKYTFQKGYGSFDSKISGTFVYEGKGLDETMLLGCYVIYGDMKYTIINAPTSESFLYVRDNNGLNGCNRYSCEFFAPEYFLTQYEFRDLPLDETESLYRGGQTTFFLCCTIQELIQRLQINIDNYSYKSLTSLSLVWEIILQGENYGISQIDPIQFDNNSIADVLQKIEEVYNLHFFIQYHPSPNGSDANAIIYIGDIVQTMPSGTIFDFGQDLGLTSSIRVSKREPMVTKLYPRGSTHNVPFRYPVILDDVGNIIEHSHYSENLLPQFTIDAIKNNVVDRTHAWRDTFKTYPTVLDFPYFWANFETNYFSWDLFDMRNANFRVYEADFPNFVGNFDFYDLNGDYADSFIDSGIWKIDKSTRNYVKYPKGNINKFKITLKKNIILISGNYVPFPRANNYIIDGYIANLEDKVQQVSHTILNFSTDVYQGRTPLDVIKKDVIYYILANNPPKLPYPNGTLTNFVNEYNSQTPFVEHIDYEDVHPTIKEATHLGKRIDMLRADSYGWSERVKKAWNDDFISAGIPVEPFMYVSAGLTYIQYDQPKDFWKLGDLLEIPFTMNESYGISYPLYMVLNENDYKDSFYVDGIWNAESPNRDFTKFPIWNVGMRREIILKRHVYQSGGTWHIYPNASSVIFNPNEFQYGRFLYFLAEDAFHTGLAYFSLNIPTNPPFLGWGISESWDDFINPDDGTLSQPVFRLPLHILGFDLFASAIENEEMFIHMTSGSCQGSRFRIAIRDWNDWVRNFYKRDENGRWKFFGRLPTTNSMTYPDTTDKNVDLIVYKDIETWGKNFVQPTALRNPKAGDTFVITGINLPDKYVENAQEQLQIRGLADLIDKNIEKFDYQFNISNIFLENHREYKEYLDTNIKIKFKYNGVNYVSNFVTISIEYGGVLPRYDVKLSDVLESVGKGGKGMGSIISLISNMLGEASGSIQPNEIRSMFNQFMAFPDRRLQTTTNEIQRSIQNNNLIISNQNNLIQENQNEIANNASQISNINARLLDLENNRPFVYIGDVIEFNNIEEIMNLDISLPENHYYLDMKDRQGIIINTITFIDKNPLSYQTDCDIGLGSLEVGQQKYISIIYPDLPSSLAQPPNYYKLTFHANNIQFVVEINGNEDYPITRVLFVNNGKFVEAYAVKGYRDSQGYVQDIIPTN